MLSAAPKTPPASRSQQLKDAGFTPRDTRLTCDECGKKFTRQMLPIHKCEAPPAVIIPQRSLDPDLRQAMAEHAFELYEGEAPPAADVQGMTDAEALARRFHETYERLAPQFGYETRQETRQFDPTTPNGRLMIAVCAALRAQSKGEKE